MNPWLLVPAFFLLCALGFVWLLLREEEADEPEPYDPSFAGEPDSVDAVHDGYERSKYFTGEEAAQLQAAAQPAVPIVASDHPSDCGDACCWEIRLDELTLAYDWDAAEHQMRSKR